MAKKIDPLTIVSVAAATAYTALAVVSVVTDRGAYDTASNLVVAVIFLALALVQLTSVKRRAAKVSPWTEAQRAQEEEALRKRT